VNRVGQTMRMRLRLCARVADRGYFWWYGDCGMGRQSGFQNHSLRVESDLQDGNARY
jgi:hypothetical protein